MIVSRARLRGRAPAPGVATETGDDPPVSCPDAAQGAPADVRSAGRAPVASAGAAAAPAALARLGGPHAAGWRLGEPFEGRGDTNVFAVEAGDCSPALLKATGSRQGRLQLERQVQVLTALHAGSAARSVGTAGAAHPGRR